MITNGSWVLHIDSWGSAWSQFYFIHYAYPVHQVVHVFLLYKSFSKLLVIYFLSHFKINPCKAHFDFQKTPLWMILRIFKRPFLTFNSCLLLNLYLLNFCVIHLLILPRTIYFWNCLAFALIYTDKVAYAHSIKYHVKTPFQ